MALNREFLASELVGDTEDLAVAEDTIIYGGAIVVTGPDGYARPGYEAPDVTVWGKAAETIDNRGKPAGAQKITVTVSRSYRKFRYDNDVNGTPLGQADLGGTCFLLNEHTLSADDNNGARSTGGTLMAVDPGGAKVWVRFPL
ncbi:hypothetical protein [Chondromyces crocatus]|uniref:Uncharacterized protein n=1 Tax=Chondromyces crocatus TaxID=52 RepID=A0A0K1EBL6_CHOCO|nr:hypothetical protein [Chondromyces crocatus]AKT38260.1 uncharacterized protein CMC5_024030 [Chondromyces crocatus]